MAGTITFFYIYSNISFELIDFSTDESEMICNLQNFKDNPDIYFSVPSFSDSLFLRSVTYFNDDTYSMSDWCEILKNKVKSLNPSFIIEDDLPF